MAKKISEIGGESPTNDAKGLISFEEPYCIKATIKGTADLLFHRWSNEGVAEKSAARKGSKAKKTDDLESYVHRNDEGNLSLLGEQFRMAIVHTAKFKQDPRSPRKSALDLYKAGIIVISEYCDLGVKDWDYVDARRVVIQKSAITRQRPALKRGWSCEVIIQINLPEYISSDEVCELLVLAGRINGMGDFRPTYGRFIVTNFERIK
jgi:hypothetical protein